MLAQVYWWLGMALYAFCLPATAPIRPITLSSSGSATLTVSQQYPPGPVFRARPEAAPCLTGVINFYTPVLSFGCDSSTLQVGNAVGLAAGDKVLLMQMQVSQVDLTNTASFGTPLNTTCIGNYEFNRIQSIGGNTVQLQFSLTRPYDLSGKVQLVRVPEYDSATVCNLTCLPWNGSVGGIVALDVKFQLTLSGNIDVSGKGFRGGLVENNIIPWFFGETQYFYPPQSTLAAAKGEGMVLLPADHSYGRGRAGNGGGGGNAHNAGGGGGGNAGAGGNGGLEITNLPATPIFNTNGIGGQKYFEMLANKILLGGGAGAGHANDALGSSGGNGGGIVMVLANTLQTNNFRILANGVDVFGGMEHNDGQGGGGGGGTVLLQVGQVTGSLPCELKGGRGGSNPYTPDFQVHGPGGGGGGGKLLLKQNSPNVIAMLQGGINGLTSQNLSHSAAPGETGKQLVGFVLPEGIQPAHPVSDHLVLHIQPPLCAGSSNGQIAVLQSSALTFRLNGGSWQSDSVFNGLAAGTYHLGLRFSGGCVLDTVATLLAPPPVRDSLLSLIQATCVNAGSLTVQAVSGKAPFLFQLNTGSWQPSGAFSGLAAGTYTVTLRDAAGCTHTSVYTVPAAPPIADSLLLLTPATCLTGGTLVVKGLAGTAPFTYRLDTGPWQMTGTFPNLSPGSYAVTTRDAAGCTHTGNYTIPAAPPVTDALVALTPAGCLTGGSITVNALSGTAPFEYQLNAGAWQNTGSFPDLPAGTYHITVRDGAGCTHTSTYTVAPPPPVADSLVALIHATCAVGGTLQVEAISGTAPFAFQLNNGSWQAIGTFDDLPADDYTVTVRDAVGCTQSNSYTIASPPLLLDSLLGRTPAGCTFGGSLTVQAFHGTAPFEYQLNGGGWQSTGVFADLVPATYTVTVRDAATCTHSSTYTVAASPVLQDSVVQIADAGCAFGGSIRVLATAGTAPFAYQLDMGSWQPTGIFLDLTPATYSVTIRDGAGCTSAHTYLVAPPPPVQDSLLAKKNAGCTFGGSITISAVAGTAPFAYRLNNSSWQPTGDFTDLPPGHYTCEVRDAAGCTHTSTYAIAPPPPVLDSLLDLEKAGCTFGGSIAIVAIAGTAPFAYRLGSGNWQSTGFFDDLPAGTYTCQIRDTLGCTQTSTYTIAPPPPVLDSLLALTDANCSTNGSLTMTPVSGTPPFEHRLNSGNWQPGGDFADLPAGNYLITVRDAAGCTQSSTVAIGTVPPVTASLVSIKPAGCTFGGTVVVAAVAGTAPFEYRLNGGPWQSTGSFTDLVPGDYTVTVRDAFGCLQAHTYTIQPPPPVRDSLLLLINAGCTLGGTLTVTSVGGTPPFTYQLNGGNWQPNGTFLHVPAGAYTLTIRDAAGCTHTNLYTIAPPPPVIDSLLSLTNAGCIYGGTLHVHAVSGTPPFTYQLNNGAGQADGSFHNLAPGNYSITLRDALGCTHTSIYPIAAPMPLLLTLDSLGDVDCLHPLGFIAVSATGGTGQHSYRLDGQDPQTTGYFSGLPAGIYGIIATDSAGCVTTLANQEVLDLIDSVLTRETVTIYEGAFYQLPDGQRTSRPGEFPFAYQTVDGCDSLHIIQVVVLKRHVYVPNIFQPDDNGHNDFFTVYADESLGLIRQLRVYDRWGELLFSKDNFLPNQDKSGWDGQFRGQPVGTGVFVWVAELEFVDGVRWRLQGDVTIVR